MPRSSGAAQVTGMTGTIDLANDHFSGKPATRSYHLTNKFMPRYPFESHITFHDLQIGIANSRILNADQYFVAGRYRYRDLGKV